MALTTLGNPSDDELKKMFDTEVPTPPNDTIEFVELRKTVTAAISQDTEYEQMPTWMKVAVKTGMLRTLIFLFQYAGDNTTKFVTLLGRIAVLEDKVSSLAAENVRLENELKEIKKNL